MRVRSYDSMELISMELIDAAARHMSFTAAAAELNPSKGSNWYNTKPR